jgi:hypothetical protein
MIVSKCLEYFDFAKHNNKNIFETMRITAYPRLTLGYVIHPQKLKKEQSLEEGVHQNFIFAWNIELSSLIQRCTIFFSLSCFSLKPEKFRDKFRANKNCS